MAHVKSYSMRNKKGIYLYGGPEDTLIGGPYETETDATRASIAASRRVGEAPIEDYQKFLSRRKILGGLLDFFIDKTSTQADEPPRSLIPEPETEFIAEVRDPEYRIKTNPNWTHWPADMDNVNFGKDDFPRRSVMESKILQAAESSGVTPLFTEGHRTEEQNKKIGGKEESKHLTGNAFDLKISGNPEKDTAYYNALRELLEPLGFGVVYFPEKNHIHVQYPRKGQ